MLDTQVQPLGWEDNLEKGMAIHSSIHAWRIPWTEEPGGLQSMGSQARIGHGLATKPPPPPLGEIVSYSIIETNLLLNRSIS